MPYIIKTVRIKAQLTEKCRMPKIRNLALKQAVYRHGRDIF